MNGQGDLAIQELNDRIRDFGGIQLARRVGALSFIHMLSGDLHSVRNEAWRMRNMDVQMRTPLVDAWSYYFRCLCGSDQHAPGPGIGKFSIGFE